MPERNEHLGQGRVWYLGLGSNLGDRAGYLRAALDSLTALRGSIVLRASSIYETDPWGLEAQDAFLNMVTELESSLQPHELLAEAKRIERELGRKERDRWGPREIDIDLLVAGDLRVESDDLTVPHPLVLERQFVLVPLAELAPDLRIGESDRVSDLVIDDGSVRPLGTVAETR